MYNVPRYSLHWGSLRLPLEPMPGIQRRLTMLSHLNGKKGWGKWRGRKIIKPLGANLTRSRICSSTWPQMSYGPFISKMGKQFKRQAICIKSWGKSVTVGEPPFLYAIPQVQRSQMALPHVVLLFLVGDGHVPLKYSYPHSSLFLERSFPFMWLNLFGQVNAQMPPARHLPRSHFFRKCLSSLTVSPPTLFYTSL